jgi:hypothetical protein
VTSAPNDRAGDRVVDDERRFRRALVLIAAAALVVRVAYVLWYSRRAPLGFDANHYFELGKGLATEHEYEIAGAHTALFPPGFPFVLAALHAVGLGTRTKLLLGMTVMGTATVTIIGLLGRRVAGETVGLVTAGIAALYPNLFLAEGALMTEALTALLVAIALLLALYALAAPSPRRFLLLGLPLGYGALTRSDGLLFAVLLVAVVAWCATARAGAPRRDNFRRENLRRVAALGAAGLAASLVLVGGWLVRDEVQMHAFLPVAVNSWDVVGGANCHSTYYGTRFGSWDATCLQLGEAVRHGDRDEIAANRYVRDRGIDYLRAHTDRVPIVVAARLGLTFGAYRPWHELAVEGTFEGRDIGWSHVGYLMYLALLPLAAWGFVTIGAGRIRKVLIVPFAAVLVSTVIGYGNQRFRMPLEPVLVILAAVGVTRLARLIGTVSSRRPTPVAAPTPAPKVIER